MRFKIFIALIILLTSFQIASAEYKTTATLSPVLGRGFGHSNYEMNTLVSADSIVVYARSKLEFPMDVFWAGGSLEFNYISNGRTDWSGNISLVTNINNPTGKMKDSDWFSSPGYQELQFAYTESDVTMSAIMLNAELSRRFYSWSNASTYLTLGLRYQKIDQDIINFSGWQLDENLEKVYYTYNDLAMLYTVKYIMPTVGLKYRLDINQKSSFAVSAAYAFTYAEDVDDHVLRYKISTADGTGAGFLGRINYYNELGKPNLQSRPFFSLYADFFTAKISTGQTQTWYGDDPISDEDDTGTVIKDIPHEITSTQFQMGLNFGLAF
ncbi:MAG: hypothetical protein AB1746_12200 [Candidatus Zixiibacteriota bacterium]